MNPTDQLDTHLKTLALPYIREHYQPLAKQTINKGLGHIDYLSQLVEGEYQQRRERGITRRIRQARFPTIKTLDTYDFTHPKDIDRLAVNELFRLHFIETATNIMLIGGCGLGKTHLAIALGYHACHHEKRVLFTSAIDMINTLAAAQQMQTFNQELRRYLKPDLLIIDELGYLPIDKFGADILFQVISGRYETGSIVLTSNRIFSDWVGIFNNDATLTTAVLDRILHHHELILLEGLSYRGMKPLE
jgi:DNA replication protein DnaC